MIPASTCHATTLSHPSCNYIPACNLLPCFICDMQKHLLNPRKCSFLQSSEAMSNSDPEVVAGLSGVLDQNNTVGPADNSDMETTGRQGTAFKCWNLSSGLFKSVWLPIITRRYHLTLVSAEGRPNNGSSGNIKKRKRDYWKFQRERVEEAEAILAALKQKHRDLTKENALMKAKMEVYTQGGRSVLPYR